MSRRFPKIPENDGAIRDSRGPCGVGVSSGVDLRV
jgi:hypothetical protein